MGENRTTYRTVLSILGAAALLAGLAACSTGQPDAAGSAGPTPSASETPTATPTPSPTPSPTPLEFDSDRTAAWAAEFFPLTGGDDYVLYTNGQVLAASDAGTSTATEVAAGSYELRVVCRGDEDSTVTITVSSANSATTVQSAPCDETVQTRPYSTSGGEVSLAVSGDGDQVVEWASVIATEPLAN